MIMPDWLPASGRALWRLCLRRGTLEQAKEEIFKPMEHMSDQEREEFAEQKLLEMGWERPVTVQRDKWLGVMLERNMPADEMLRLIAPMRDMTQEEKEVYAARMLVEMGEEPAEEK